MSSKEILLIDNYDSFTYNLLQRIGELGFAARVVRNDVFKLSDIESWEPFRIILSPGPCTPNEAGLSVDVVKHFGKDIPILGVCLGHQSIAQAYGAKVLRAKRVMHGKTSEIKHDGKSIYSGVPENFPAARYHSLIVCEESLPEELMPVSYTADQNELMGIRHTEYPVEGVQFHPESFLTEIGYKLLKNFLNNGIKNVHFNK